MAKLKNAVEIVRLLEKSNCRECSEPTCMAFAAAVFNGKRQLGDCPRLSREIVEKYSGQTEKRTTIEQDIEESLGLLKKRVESIDLASAAKRLETGFTGENLTIKVLGKDVSVDARGNLSSDIHINPWVTIPILNYIIDGAGVPVSGKWIPFRELKGGLAWAPLFGQRCEKPLKLVADTYTELFEDMIQLFNGKQVENHYSSDISLVLSPLPKVPLLICYWKEEDGLESSLNLFFDSTAEENLNIDSLYNLCAGLVKMFEKISQRHGVYRDVP